MMTRGYRETLRFESEFLRHERTPRGASASTDWREPHASRIGAGVDLASISLQIYALLARVTSGLGGTMLDGRLTALRAALHDKMTDGCRQTRRFLYRARKHE